LKRVLFVAFTMLMLCSILLLIILGIAKAGNPDYSFIEYPCIEPATIDGEWTSGDEWTDGPIMKISDNANFTWNVDMTSGVVTDYAVQILVEIFDDDTDDAEDYWQICIDSDNSEGTAPQSNDYKIDIIGHTSLVCYEGNGTDWDLITPDEGEIEWADSISDSPWDSTPHWILEFSILKETGTIYFSAPPNGVRIAVYDASNSQAGVQAWAPDSDPNVPAEWGLISDYSDTPIPEGFSLGVVVLLSFVAVAVSLYFLRKWPKTRSCSSRKTGEINYTS